MESKRQQKVAKLIQKNLADIFQQDIKSQFGKAFITVTNTKVSPDLALAKVYLSLFLVEKPQEMLALIDLKKKEIRKLLGTKIGKQVRVLPDLQFILDDSAEYAAKMDKLISGLEIPPADESDEK